MDYGFHSLSRSTESSETHQFTNRIPLKLLLSSVINIMNDVLTAMNQDDLTFFHDSQAEIQFEDIIDFLPAQGVHQPSGMNARDKLFNWDVSFEDLMCFNFNNPNVINFVDADDYAFDSKYDHYIDTDCDSNTAASISVTQQNSNINNSTINLFTSSAGSDNCTDRIISSQNQPEQAILSNIRSFSTPSLIKPAQIIPIHYQPSEQKIECLMSAQHHAMNAFPNSPLQRQGSPVSITYSSQSIVQISSCQTQPESSQDVNSDRLIGMYTVKERQQKIALFRHKKMQRIHRKHVKYISRKKLAEERPRVKGRFTTRLNMTP